VETPSLELLAPARDADIGIEAGQPRRRCGCISAAHRSAHARGANEIAEPRAVVEHAHHYNARVFRHPHTSCAKTNWSRRASRSGSFTMRPSTPYHPDVGLLELDCRDPASRQHPDRHPHPEKARFLQDVGSPIVLARELDLEQIAASAPPRAPETTLEFFVHGALCVAYSGQSTSAMPTPGASANRGDCSQACRLPYQVTDMEGRVVAHDKHVLSMKDNNQSDNLEALIDAGIRSFKIEGRYKDMGYVKNITAHYRTLLDQIIERRPEFARASSAAPRLLHARPQPELQPRVHRLLRRRPQGRHRRIRHAEESRPAGRLRQQGRRQMGRNCKPTRRHRAQQRRRPLLLHAAERPDRPRDQPRGESGGGRLAVFPKDRCRLQGLRAVRWSTATATLNWTRLLDKSSSARRIGVWLRLEENRSRIFPDLDRRGRPHATVAAAHAKEPAKDAAKAEATLREHLGKARHHRVCRHGHLRSICRSPGSCRRPSSTPCAAMRRRPGNRTRRGLRPSARAPAVEPPAIYPEDTLSYLANVYNHKARDFYAKHGVQVIAAAYESHEETGEVSLRSPSTVCAIR